MFRNGVPCVSGMSRVLCCVSGEARVEMERLDVAGTAIRALQRVLDRELCRESYAFPV